MYGMTRLAARSSTPQPTPVEPAWKRQPVYAEAVGAVPSASGLAEGIAMHERAVKGDKAATQQAVKVLSAVCEREPGNTLALAYLGSATALLGRDAIDPNEQFSHAMRGLKLLDQAVERAPDDIQVRTLRGYVCLNLPQAYFQRGRCAVEDFGHLARLHESGRACLPEGFYCEVLYNLGLACKETGRLAEAYETWKKLLAVTTDPRYRALLKNEGMVNDPFADSSKGGARSGHRR